MHMFFPDRENLVERTGKREVITMFLSVMWLMTAMVAGFMVGRISMYGWGDGEEETSEKEEAARERKPGRRGKGHRQQEESIFCSVGSPVSGEITMQKEGEHPMVMIYPDSDRLYAPASGKITKLFPMGNAFWFTTESGMELYIQAGEVNDELLSCYFRPRVIQNEVVSKGKLLLEFDRWGLEEEGVSAAVSVQVEHCLYGGDIRLVEGEHVGAGEDILQVRETFGREAVSVCG